MERWCSILTEQSEKTESSQFHSDQLNHGFFQFTLPHTWIGWLSWSLAPICFILALVIYLKTFEMPKFYVPNTVGAGFETTNDEYGWALTLAVIGSILLMLSTPSSLSQDLAKLRECKQPRRIISVSDGEVKETDKSRKNDDYDWILPPPKSEVFLKNPWHGGPEEDLIPEHPQLIGTPQPASTTLYSLGAISYVYFSILLSSFILHRASGQTSEPVEYVLKYFFVILSITFNIFWAFKSYHDWRVIHNIQDMPTSTIRSIAVGPAEIVGQAIPMPNVDTITAKVGSKKIVMEIDGCLNYHWIEEKLVKRNKSSHWVKVASKSETGRFIIHDGTGGIIVEPSTFDKKELGPPLNVIRRGKRRWTIRVITTFDPVFCLGRVEKREEADLAECSSDKTIQQSLLVMRGNKDIGMQTKFSRGTELGLMKRVRSSFELIFVPILLLVSSIIPFLW